MANSTPLVQLFQQAMNEIQTELRYIALKPSREQQKTVARIKQRLAALLSRSYGWVEEVLPEIFQFALEHTLKNTPKSDISTEKLSKSKHLVYLLDSYKQDTQNDVLNVVNTMQKRILSMIQRAMTEVLVGKDELFVRKTLENSVNYGLVDTAHRVWKPTTYVQVVGEQKAMNLYRDATLYACLELGIDYAIISSHGATDVCSPYEGMIVKLTTNANGEYATYDEVMRTGAIFHVHCKHVLIPVENPLHPPTDIQTEHNRPSFEARVLGLPLDA